MVPGVNGRTINDLVQGVIDALQGRTDITAIIPRYIKRALQELTISMAFEELRRTGPQVTLTVGQPIYPVSTFLNSGDDYNYPEAFVIFVDPGTNKTTDTLKYKTPKAIEMMISPSTQGTPGYFTRFGTNFHLGPVPNQAFTVFLRYQVRYPFPAASDSTSLLGVPLLIPDDWEEIVEYAAAERIAFVKRWNEQRNDIHQLLYGDPEFMESAGKRGRPGLLSARLLQVERDQKFDTRQLGFTVPRYNGR
jgi:hypothetical protein